MTVRFLVVGATLLRDGIGRVLGPREHVPPRRWLEYHASTTGITNGQAQRDSSTTLRVSAE